MKFSIKEFFSKSDQIHRKLQIWSHLLKKTLMENFIFCEVKQGGLHWQKTENQACIPLHLQVDQFRKSFSTCVVSLNS